MDRVAVFVDAGYFFTQGSVALSGSQVKRHLLDLKLEPCISFLATKAQVISGRDLLRVYWYDGAPTTGPTAQHISVALASNVKLRLGFLNSYGKQKGVDSLIVTDLIELARNRAIADAVVLAGDEDLRVGIQVAQSFGVRVHLLGICPSHASQSRQLLQEADTCAEITSGEVARMLGVREEIVVTNQASSLKFPSFADAVRAVRASVPTEGVGLLLDEIRSSRRLPAELDGQLLRACKGAADRDLTDDEKRDVRKQLRTSLEEKTPEAT